jgi:hypothetical protein
MGAINTMRRMERRVLNLAQEAAETPCTVGEQ